jgi:hypothetical protein
MTVDYDNERISTAYFTDGEKILTVRTKSIEYAALAPHVA